MESDGWIFSNGKKEAYGKEMQKLRQNLGNLVNGL